MSNKTYGQKTFQLNDKMIIECETYETRYSWGHKAYFYLDGRQVEYAKCIYYNRTWESYTYQSIIHKIIDKAVKGKGNLREVLKKKADEIGSGNIKKELGSIAMIAKLGDIFATNKKGANDWKARMLKAGLGNSGLSMPDDWDQLSEDEKEKRLNGAIDQLK